VYRPIILISAAILGGCSQAPTTLTPPVRSALPAVAIPVSHNSINWMLSHPWHHVDGPVTEQQFKQDKAKCAMMAEMAPVGAGTPEIKFDVVFIHCLRAEGYESEP
jgi:hypothetical protein